MSRLIDIVCLNPAMDRTVVIDRLVPGEVHRTRECISVAGGKGVNVARFLKQVNPDANIRLTGFAGGVIGSYLRKECSAIGIQDAFTEIAGESRICSIIVDDTHSTVINEDGPHVAAAEIDQFRATLSDQADLAVVSGSAPAGVQTDLYAEIVQFYKNKSIPVYLDASGTALETGIAAGPTLIKPNEYEFCELVGVDKLPDMTEIPDRCGAIFAHGVEHVIVSLGEKGSCLVSRGQEAMFYPTADIQAVNPIACGDAMVAGVIDGVLHNEFMEEALLRGVALVGLNAANLAPIIEAPERYENVRNAIRPKPLVRKTV